MSSLALGIAPSPRGIFTLTIFLSAALVFAVQPMVGKMLLPLVGGAPSGWLTTLAFFQVALLLGYLVAHLLSRLTPRGQMLGTLLFLLAGCVMLPPQVRSAAGIENVGNAGQVLWLLLLSVSIPYLALSTVSSGLQRLYAAQAQDGKDPYFLYAASNAGSFIGLLTYPVLVEPLLPVSAQSQAWAWLYGALIALIGYLLLRPAQTATMSSAQDAPMSAPEDKITWGRRLQWVMLAFIPSSLSMGLTALITTDMGSIPLFWVVPLGLYLLTFVVAFQQGRRTNMADLSLAQGALLAIVIFVLVWANGKIALSAQFSLVLLATFFITALMCHMQAADLRPTARRLTEYYLWLAFGGALGGSFNAFLVPLIFPEAIEFYLMLFASALLHAWPQKKKHGWLSILGVIIALGAAATACLTPGTLENRGLLIAAFVALLAGSLLTALAPRLFAALGIGVIAMTSLWAAQKGSVVDVQRNFFGVVKIIDRVKTNGDVWRKFYHGTTVHGMQRIAPTRDVQAASYYDPLRAVIAAYNPKEVGVLGLGAGLMLCMQAPGRHFTMYEIDPLVVDMARKWFTYIQDCGEPEWRIGDGRLELERDQGKRFDMLIMDAFSSDSVPTHLVTREALQLYLQRLKPDGLIVFNISNRYYDLRSSLTNLARDAGLQSLTLMDLAENPAIEKASSMWIVLAPAGVNLDALRTQGWTPHAAVPAPVWQDDFVNLISALRMLQNAQAR